MTQAALPLPTDPLREAYALAGYYQRGISFDTAMKHKHLSIPLRNVAAGIAKRSLFA